MKLKEVLDKTTAFFKDKKFDTPRLDAELLLAHGLKLERIQLYLRFDQPLKEDELAACRELVRRRASGEPVAYILGYRDFFGHRFEVTPQVLIPRPETEHIIENVREWAAAKDSPWGFVDLGTGSGCIGLSLLVEYPQARLVAVDVSSGALEVARRNAEALEVSDRVRFVNSDAAATDLVMSVYKEFAGQSGIDVLVSNPPYIAFNDSQVEENVKKYEPNSALFAEDQGLALLKAWSTAYAPYLKDSSLLLMEMGTTHGSAMRSHLEVLKIFNEISVLKDLSGHDRVIRGEKHG